MARRPRNQSRKANKPPQSNGRAPRRRSRSFIPTMDPSARSYARLLADPCGAPLVHPLYGSGATGYLVRLQKTFTLNQDNASGRPIGLVYAPGLITDYASATPDVPENVTTGNTRVTAVLVSKNDAGGTEYLTRHLNQQPGRAFFTSTVPNISLRPVAACAKARYIGSELDRAGSVFTGYAPTVESILGVEPNASGVATGFADAMISSAQFSSRMPDGQVEVRWAPGRQDQRFKDLDVTFAYSDGAMSAHSAMFMCFNGLKQNTAMEITLTCVYEWLPNAQSGFVIPTECVQSSTTLDSVLGYMRSFGNWFTSAEYSAKFARELALRAASKYLLGANGMTGSSARQRIEL